MDDGVDDFGEGDGNHIRGIIIIAGGDLKPEFPGVDFDCEVDDGGEDGVGDFDGGEDGVDDGVDDFGDGDHNKSKGMGNQPLSATTCVCIK